MKFYELEFYALILANGGFFIINVIIFIYKTFKSESGIISRETNIVMSIFQLISAMNMSIILNQVFAERDTMYWITFVFLILLAISGTVSLFLYQKEEIVNKGVFWKSKAIEYQGNTYYKIEKKSKGESNLWDGLFHKFVYITIGNEDILYQWSGGNRYHEGDGGEWHLNSDGNLYFYYHGGGVGYDACFSQVAALSHKS